MKIHEIAELTDAEIIYIPENFDNDIKYAGASDLMSDVLAYLSEMPTHISKDMMLITGPVSPQSIRTTALTDIPVVLFTRGKVPNANIIEGAKSSGLVVMSSKMTSYTVCGRLFAKGIRGVDTNSIE